MKDMNFLLRALTISTLTVVAASSAFAASVEVNESFPLNPDGRIHVENINGPIVVRAWDGQGVKLEAIKKGRTAAVAEAIEVKVESKPERIKITTQLAKKSGWFGGNQREGEVSYTLSVPAGALVDKAASVNGNVTIEGIAGAVQASTVNGSITGLRLGGALDLSTVNGKINCEYLGTTSAALSLSTVNGAIELALPEDMNARLKASAVNGGIRSDLAIADIDQGRNRLNGRLGDGGPTLKLTTVNGGIHLRPAAGGKAKADGSAGL